MLQKHSPPQKPVEYRRELKVEGWGMLEIPKWRSHASESEQHLQIHAHVHFERH